MQVILAFVIGYLFGAFPTGYFLGRLYGVDVRRLGSGRTGGSNVLRTIGWPAFILTVSGDILKGILPVLLVTHLLAVGQPVAAAFTVIGVLIGNNWSIIIAWLARDDSHGPPPSNAYEFLRSVFARARGGAGVTTTAAGALTLYWPPVIPLVIVGISVLIVVRYSSVASMTVALLYPFAMAYFVMTGSAPWIYLPMSIFVGLIVLYVLTPNMRRLRAGTEQRFGQRVEVK